jgi:prepilin-type processing-associated H-X9-DG protein
MKLAGCVNNLKHIGLSFRIYSADNNDQFPFANTNVGGTSAFANSPQVFRHFAALSNEVNNPKTLVCPQDTQRTRALDFSAFSNSNLSYFVGLDADEDKPERLLSGDRNITGGMLSNGFLRLLKTNTPAGWTPEMHKGVGNVALADGSVMQTIPDGLRQHLKKQGLPVIRLAIP